MDQSPRNMRIHGFTRVKNTEMNKEGTVEDYLSKQFTVNYDDKTFGFLFYADKGVTWEPLDEAKQRHKAELISSKKLWATTAGFTTIDDDILMDLLEIEEAL